MRRFLTLACAMALAAMAVPAGAEKTVAVNDPAAAGVFDQPSVAISGPTAHVANIGAPTAAGPFRVYYAAINGGSDFSDLSLSRSTPGFLVIPPTLIDNTAAGNSSYVDARHPKIAISSAGEAVIFFQAKTVASPDPTYALYMARLTLGNNVVVKRSVRLVTGVSGYNEDLSFGLVTTGDAAWVAYAGRTGITGDFQVYCARISLETASVTGTPGTPLRLSSAAGSTGARPLPSLQLDSLNRVHVAWAANDNTSSPNGVYYSMVKEVNGADTVAIAATEILGRPRKWGYPNLLAQATNLVLILAADESVPGVAGNIGLVRINPDADDQNGSTVQVTVDTNFIYSPPGETILAESSSLFRPEAVFDILGQIHVTGYGNSGTRSTYYAFAFSNESPYVNFVKTPAPVGLDSVEFPVSLAGDYTKAAVGYFNDGKVVIFWSGAAAAGNRNLDVTGLPTVRAIQDDQTGCLVVPPSFPGDTGANADFLLLLLPAAALWIRRVMRQTIGK
jgi:hypothetical protein